jgi:hypothetical protein
MLNIILLVAILIIVLVLHVAMLSTLVLNVILLNSIMLSAFMLNVIMLNVQAPSIKLYLHEQIFIIKNARKSIVMLLRFVPWALRHHYNNPGYADQGAKACETTIVAVGVFCTVKSQM